MALGKPVSGFKIDLEWKNVNKASHPALFNYDAFGLPDSRVIDVTDEQISIIREGKRNK